MGNRDIMKIEATAVWNAEKGSWEVRVNESGTRLMYPSKEWEDYVHKAQFEVSECDEFVFIQALAKMNGINAEALNLNEDNIKVF